MLPALILLLALLVAGCGGERKFDADEFVAAMSDEGAALELGDPLPSSQEGLELTAITLAGAHENGPGAAQDEHGHPGGSGVIVVAEDAAAASAEYERCDRALTLTCYRAANVVLYFEAPPSDPALSPIDAAIRALANE